MRKTELLYFDAGGGHRSAAVALQSVLEREASNVVGVTSLQRLLDPIDPVRRLTGRRIEDLYNFLLRRGWTRGAENLLVPLHAAIRHYHPQAVQLLERHWRESEPSLVVSLVPQFGRAIFESLRRFDSAIPLITILTDFADFPPHCWIEPQEQFYICGTERAAEQAAEIGVPPGYVLRSSGMIVHPRFYGAPAIDREEERARLGLHPRRPTGLVLFGGYGPPAMAEIARRLDDSGLDLQLILICGGNGKLAHSLRHERSRCARVVVGFTREVPFYMQLSDFFIGKPGPGSLSEALLMNLPVIVERNARTMPQERYNADWLRERQVGLAVKDFREIVSAVEQFLRPGQLDAYRARVATLQNRAIFEIPAMLQRIASRTALPAAC
jgi:hypothetical protein